MVSPRFLDTVQTTPGNLTQAAPGGGSPFVLSGGNSSGIFGSLNRSNDLISHYSYWNFVAINRICDRVSTMFPNVGYKQGSQNARGGLQSSSPGRSGFQSRHLTQSQRQHLTRFYGGVFQSFEDLAPVPEGHPLVNLLQAVNPCDTWQSLVEDTFLFLQLTGEFYWWIMPSQLTMASGYKLPAEIWLVPTQFVTKNRDRDGSIKSYTIRATGFGSFEETVPPEEIIYLARKNPFNRDAGFSPIQAAPFWTTNVEQIEASRFAGFRNGINPDLIVTLSKDAQPMSADGTSLVGSIKEKLMQRAAGFMRNREPVVIPPGVDKVEKWSNSPREMDFGASADQARDQGLALHGVPKVIAGITTDVNRATVEGANVVFCENVLNPNLARFGGFLTEKLARRYDPRIVVWYDDCTPHNAEQELRENQLDFQMGAYDPDERRVDRGRKPKGETGYQSGYIPSSVVPLSDSVKDENMERALEIAGNRSADNPEDSTGDNSSDPEKPDNSTEDGGDAKSKSDRKQRMAHWYGFPGLDHLA